MTGIKAALPPGETETRQEVKREDDDCETENVQESQRGHKHLCVEERDSHLRTRVGAKGKDSSVQEGELHVQEPQGAEKPG